MYHVLLHFCYLDLVKIWYIFHPNFGILLCVPWYIGTLVHWTLCTLGTLLLVHWYIFTLVHCHVPCTHVLLHFCYLDLVKILVHLSPQLWDFIMCTLVHWYTGTLDIVYPGYIASGTSLPWYIVMYHVPMYSSTFATWT